MYILTVNQIIMSIWFVILVLLHYQQYLKWQPEQHSQYSGWGWTTKQLFFIPRRSKKFVSSPKSSSRLLSNCYGEPFPRRHSSLHPVPIWRMCEVIPPFPPCLHGVHSEFTLTFIYPLLHFVRKTGSLYFPCTYMVIYWFDVSGSYSATLSSRGVLPIVARRCVWTRNLENEEAKAPYRAVKTQPQWVVTPRKTKQCYTGFRN
jgi:hypothetical protein